MLTTAIKLCLIFLITTGFTNFHQIDKDKFYRSGQLSGEQLKKVIDFYKIKTIVNLRGASSGSDWFDEEVEATKDITRVDIRMSAQRLPHQKDLIQLLDVYKNAERPLLVHCQAGADRTGEASAIYQMEYMGKSKSQALKMLTIKYFHLKSQMPAKRYFMGLYEGESWARNNYDPCKSDYKYYDKEKFCE